MLQSSGLLKTNKRCKCAKNWCKKIKNNKTAHIIQAEKTKQRQIQKEKPCTNSYVCYTSTQIFRQSDKETDILASRY